MREVHSSRHYCFPAVAYVERSLTLSLIRSTSNHYSKLRTAEKASNDRGAATKQQLHVPYKSKTKKLSPRTDARNDTM